MFYQKNPKVNSASFWDDRFSNKYKERRWQNEKIVYWLSRLTCIIAMGMAVASVNSTCFFTAYQPDIPESLEKFGS